MRYKKGSKVEVLSKTEVPSGSWRSAKIIWGNGRNYDVRYVTDSNITNEASVERVNRKSIRPCPPPVGLSENWIPGDVVEVFDNLSWKMAIVSKILGRDYFLVRLVGSFLEFRISKFDLRVRQSWQDDEWIVIGKVSGNFGEEKRNEGSSLKFNHNSWSHLKQMDAKMNLQIKDGCIAAENNINIQDSRIVSSITLKRASPYCYSQFEAHEGTTKKCRMTQEKGRLHQVVAANPPPSPEKVAVASTRELLGEKYVHSSFNNEATGFSKMDVEREKQNGAVACSRTINLEPKDADNVTCSVGSCSITSNNFYKLPRHFSTGPVEDTEGYYSDAESFCRLGYEEGNCLIPTREQLVEEIHSLELHAYRCTMEALHASGPLSWEQETLVTDLRISLHISNDEHLMELRNLISTATSIPIN